MGNCCSDEVGHGGAHPVGPASAKAAQAASAAADRFLRSRNAGASTQIEVRSPPRDPHPRLSLSASNLGDQEYFPKLFCDSYANLSAIQMLKLEEQEFLGEAACLLSEQTSKALTDDMDLPKWLVLQVVTKQDRLLTLKLGISEHNFLNPSKFGELILQAEESPGSKAIMEMVFRCSDLEIKDLLTKSVSFWSHENPLIIECFNFSNNGKHDLVGKIVKSVAELEHMYHRQNGENFFVPASNAHECHSKEVLKTQLHVEKYVENNRHTFLDYISAGCQLNFMVGIDFTDPEHVLILSSSIDVFFWKAILEIGDVLQYYDPAKRFPSWGFGARPIDGPVSHCFNLNGSTYQPEVDGIQGIMSAYISALRNVSLAGPTLFGQLISTAMAIASQSLADNQQKYFILLIVTDGVVTDFQETIDAIIKASDLPMSIIVIGVGGADFKEMEFLDPNKGEKLESSTGRVASRDMLQFAPMKDAHGSGVSTVQSLLAEIPGQFMTYMRTREIQTV
ncbi:hypothetical protein HU200_038631 [Digitaria exilis]|uniref:VWFA domain-containing protein n=1 Tax=Digitaria exilis TaxID=1010633 RepID=A0A835BBC7_9POAL|nr:hypothetical protein HU200_038631 [Digitaria exilis]